MKFSFVILAIMLLSGCAENANTKATVDSTLTQVDSAANAVWDSTKEKVKGIKENLDSAFKKKDSLD
jgi:PBP1b-binding outer membrane lipoprotein LpoB